MIQGLMFYISTTAGNDSFDGLSNATSNATNSISIPAGVFNITDSEIGIFFSFYNTPVLFPLAIPEGVNESNDTIDSSVIAAEVPGINITNLTSPVEIVLTSERIQSGMVSNALCLVMFIFANNTSATFLSWH